MRAVRNIFRKEARELNKDTALQNRSYIYIFVAFETSKPTGVTVIGAIDLRRISYIKNDKHIYILKKKNVKNSWKIEK